MSAHSPTGAMEEIFAKHADFADGCVAALAPVDHQVGALFLIDGRIAGLDLFDRTATLRKLLPKLVRSVAIDALDRPANARVRLDPSLSATIAEHFLAALSAARFDELPTIGEGRAVRIQDPRITGAALVTEGGVVHLSAFHA